MRFFLPLLLFAGMAAANPYGDLVTSHSPAKVKVGDKVVTATFKINKCAIADEAMEEVTTASVITGTLNQIGRAHV